MPNENRGGRPKQIHPKDRVRLRRAHKAFVLEWAKTLNVGHMTIRRALENNTKKGSDDSTATSP